MVHTYLRSNIHFRSVFSHYMHRKITPLTVLPVYLSSFMRIGSMFMGWLLVTLLLLVPSVSSNLTQLWFDVLSVMISENNCKNLLISKFVSSCNYVCTACSRQLKQVCIWAGHIQLVLSIRDAGSNKILGRQIFSNIFSVCVLLYILAKSGWTNAHLAHPTSPPTSNASAQPRP